MMSLVKPPRAAFINFPLGHQSGKPHDRAMQKRILQDTLAILETAKGPGVIVDLPYEWDEPFGWQDYRDGLQEMLEEEGSPVQHWTPEK